MICGGCGRLRSDTATSDENQQSQLSAAPGSGQEAPGQGDGRENVPMAGGAGENTPEQTGDMTGTGTGAPDLREQTWASEGPGTEQRGGEQGARQRGAQQGGAEGIEELVEQHLAAMTLEEKVAQLFIVLPESLIDGVDHVTAAGETTRKAISDIPVGGFIYLSANLRSEEQVKAMLGNTQVYSMERVSLPMFLCVDEEGGSVARIGGTGKFQVPVIGDMRDIGETKDPDNAYQAGAEIGSYLSKLGFNVDFAPVADVLSNPDNQVVKRRSFGEDPETVSRMCRSLAEGLHSRGILSCYKHFPGHGATAGDTHKGYAFTEKNLDELKACELVPFQEAALEGGIPFIMIGHLSLPNVIGDDTPASLSSVIITDLLREDMGYDGIIITDAMNMGAVVQQYSSAEGAVKALEAGADVILMPSDFKAAYKGVLQAVESGGLSPEKIDESLRRILRVKLNMK